MEQIFHCLPLREMTSLVVWERGSHRESTPVAFVPEHAVVRRDEATGSMVGAAVWSNVTGTESGGILWNWLHYYNHRHWFVGGWDRTICPKLYTEPHIEHLPLYSRSVIRRRMGIYVCIVSYTEDWKALSKPHYHRQLNYVYTSWGWAKKTT